jgi:hypothetical protein
MLAPLLYVDRCCGFGEGQNEPGAIKESHVEMRYDPALLVPINTSHGSTNLFKVLVLDVKVKVVAAVAGGQPKWRKLDLLVRIWRVIMNRDFHFALRYSECTPNRLRLLRLFSTSFHPYMSRAVPKGSERVTLGARRRTKSTYALSITGAAGPEAGDEKVPKGTMYVGLADAAGAIALHRQFLGDRQRIRTFTVQMALDLLRRRIGGRP